MYIHIILNKQQKTKAHHTGHACVVGWQNLEILPILYEGRYPPPPWKCMHLGPPPCCFEACGFANLIKHLFLKKYMSMYMYTTCICAIHYMHNYVW